MQTHPFASPIQTSSESEAQPPTPESLEKAQSFGYNWSSIPLFAPEPEPAAPIQAKLTIGEPGDSYEQEADRVAAQVVDKINTPQPQQTPAGETVQQTGAVQRQKPVGQEENQDIEAVADSLMPIAQQNVIEPRIQRWISPLDWLDYFGLGVDLAERISIELGYPEGKEKDFHRFVNNLYTAIDVILAITPGAGGGGLAVRTSHELGVAAWAATPDSIKLRIVEKLAQAMGWGVERALEAANVFFSSSGEGQRERRDLDSHENAEGHTEDKHVGRSESWLRNRLQREPNLPMASSFRNEAIANRTQGQFVKQFRAEIEAWLKSGRGKPLMIEFDMGEPLGIVVERGRNGGFQPAVETTRARVVVVRDNSAMGWHILTSFPIK